MDKVYDGIYDYLFVYLRLFIYLFVLRSDDAYADRIKKILKKNRKNKKYKFRSTLRRFN